MSAAQEKMDIIAIGQCKYSGQLTPEDIAGKTYPVKTIKNTCDDKCSIRDAIRILRKTKCLPAPPRYNRRMIIKFCSDTENNLINLRTAI